MNKSFIYRTFFLISLFLVAFQTKAQDNIISADDVFSEGTSKFLKNFDTNLMFVNDFQSSQSNTLGGNANINALEAFLSSDLKKFTPMNGSFMAHFVHIGGTNPAEKIGDTQSTSNIAMPETVNRMADLWYEQNLGERFQLLGGIHDISSEFYVTDSSLNFTHASFGTGAELSVSGPRGPSLYPITTIGLRLNAQITDKIALKTALYDADPGDETTYSGFKYHLSRDEGALALTELAYQTDKRKTGLGGWGYSVKQAHLAEESIEARSAGIYVMHEENINDHLSVFARYGYANPNASMIESNAVIGGVYKGLFQKDMNDEIGFGVSRARFSKHYLTSLNAPAEEEETEDEVSALADEEVVAEETSPIAYKNNETAYELYYQFKPMKALLLRPDLQLVQNPSGDPAISNAFVMGLRAQISL